MLYDCDSHTFDRLHPELQKLQKVNKYCHSKLVLKYCWQSSKNLFTFLRQKKQQNLFALSLFLGRLSLIYIYVILWSLPNMKIKRTQNVAKNKVIKVTDGIRFCTSLTYRKCKNSISASFLLDFAGLTNVIAIQIENTIFSMPIA